MTARTPRKIGRKIPSAIAGSRSAVGTSTDLAAQPPGAVPRVVVAIAEEDEVVERRRAPGSRSSPGSPGLRSRARRARRRSSARCLKTRSECRPKSRGTRSCRTGNRRTVTPLHLLGACRQLVPPGHVVAGARGHHLDVGVPREPFGDVACVQLRAAVDVSAVALNRDRELHESDEVSAPGGALRTGRRVVTAGASPPLAARLGLPGRWPPGRPSPRSPGRRRGRRRRRRVRRSAGSPSRSAAARLARRPAAAAARPRRAGT